MGKQYRKSAETQTENIWASNIENQRRHKPGAKFKLNSIHAKLTKRRAII